MIVPEPLMFSDDQIEAVLDVAARLKPGVRPLLLRWLALVLPAGEVGDDALAAALALVVGESGPRHALGGFQSFTGQGPMPLTRQAALTKVTSASQQELENFHA